MIAILMVNLVVIGIGTKNTGPVEKAVLALFDVLLGFAAYKVQTLRRPSAFHLVGDRTSGSGPTVRL